MTSSIIEELLLLRNKVHKGDFRFNLGPELWSSHYLSEEEINDDRLVQIRENGGLVGYAVLEYSTYELNKISIIREMCASSSEVFLKIVDKITEKALEQNVDFIVWRKCQEPFDELLNEKGFLTFEESIVMIALLNLRDFLKSLAAKEVDDGKIAKLGIKGFEPLSVKIGRDSLSIAGNDENGFAISTDGLTFVRLFLGQTSFFKEWLKGKLKVSVFNFNEARRFFSLIENKRWYIPSGDWC